MAVIDQLAGLLLTAERASADGAVTIDVFQRNDSGAAGGELVPMWSGSSPIGRIVAESGRICWVMAKGCDTTVSDLLAAETGIPRRQLEEVYHAARTAGSPFCETLAAAGLVSAEDVRNTLRRQTAVAATTLARTQAQEQTVVSVARIPTLAYDAHFTYDALGVIAAAAAESAELRSELGAMPASYAALAPRLAAALCFLESEDSELSLVPVASTARSGVGLSEAVALALEGLAASEPSDPVLGEIAPFPLVPNGEAEWWLCEHDSPHLCLYQVTSESEYLDVLERLIAGRRARAPR